jgi:iron complex transport system substrate-binding protein
MRISRILALTFVATIITVLIAALYYYVLLQQKRLPEEIGITVVDQLGRTVHIKKVERIVSLWPEATRVLFALGVGDRVVGLDTHSRTCPILTRAFPWIKNITDVGSITTGFDIEKIAQLKPDIIFVRPDDPKFVEDLQTKLGVPVVAVRFNPPGREREWSFDIITIIGRAVGRESRAKELRDFLERKLYEITNVTSKIPESRKPKVYQAWAHDLLTTMAWPNEIIYAGGVNVAYNPRSPTPWVKVSLEQIAAWDPDIIILHGFGKWNPEDLYRDPSWQQIKAVKEHRVYKLTLGWAGWDPASIVIQVLQCAKIFHPDIFRELDVEVEANKIFKLVYGVDNLYTRLKIDYGLSI